MIVPTLRGVIPTLPRDDLQLPSDDLQLGGHPPEVGTLLGSCERASGRGATIIEASLARRFPEIRDKVFLNLSQTDGPPVLLSVRVLLDRVKGLNAAASTPREKEAFALLTQRGLTAAVLAEVEGLLATAEVPVAETPIDAEDLAEQQAKAEEALWAWYQEWSAIARRAVSDRRVLRALGFLRSARTSAEEAEDEQPAAPADPLPPTPAPV